jgi:hypothetical protein
MQLLTDEQIDKMLLEEIQLKIKELEQGWYIPYIQNMSPMELIYLTSKLQNTNE